MLATVLVLALQQAAPAVPRSLLLLLGALLLLGGLLLLGYLLLRRHRDWLGGRLLALDAFLARRTPRLWRAIRRRFSRDAWHGLTLTLATLVFLGLLFLFAVITESWQSEGALLALDQAVNEALRERLSAGFLAAVAWFTRLGGVEGALPITLVLALVLALRRSWWRLLALLLSVGVGAAVMWGLKLYFARLRPEGPLFSPTSASFPSGHSFTAMALYGFLLFLLWRWTPHPALRAAASLVLGLVIVLVGLSRVLLSVHWVSDVLGGLAVGLAWLIFSLMFVRALQHLFGRRKQALPP
ncbi:MAG: phosphatase PAP2 family protein [Rhodothermales bacterium]|nr:phosphatase PAP2 family protein [Rhodothermales bacterium]